jgi:hypothetical protein
MTKKILKSVLLVATTITLFSFDLPTGWFKAGDKPNSYEMGIDKSAGKDGKNAATIKSVDKKIDGFGTLMQECNAGKFLGKRIRMIGYVKSENVTNWAGLWMRVDQMGSEKPLSFDNMENRAIKGTTPWTKYEIVLDVPANSSILAYGALLCGTGQIWFDKLTFEIVDNSVKTTDPNSSGQQQQETIYNEPTNLDFDK